ncbi:hypothetical protein H5P28_15765 [Ruficoccus amylovorans]|uniref:Enolase C-terminal domain-containing protein n=1 Tax=Ruficoccus amylovorans TaxID=1804625 RepID=A0A842HJC3_9BACT|nr:hypothetical protein [Ruficoccus amylovorans]MBC2595724.1 hypothetical protein [Ruficoccus amylovorans]
MKIRILEASVEFIEQPFLRPLQISSGTITQTTEARVRVRVCVGSEEAEGRGSIYLSDLWAWPGGTEARGQKERRMRELCEHLAAGLFDACGGEPEHPLELGLRLHERISALDFFEEMPLLAKAVCASPFDAAIHDASGQAMRRSAFDFYCEPCAVPSADHWFTEGVCQAVRQILRQPLAELDAWWIVSAKDDLDAVMRQAVGRHGIGCFKVKILGTDNEADALRTSQIYQAARRQGVASPVLSIDSNEGNPDADAVLDYLERLKATDEHAYAALDYIEQPTARDIVKHPFNWQKVGARKPVFLDEGLTSLELLPVAREQGWSGLALKTCKGHSFALVSAAWALNHGMKISLQDLTNPGFSAIHAYLFGAYLPVRKGVELNSPQYTPGANEPWLPRLDGLFCVKGGKHRLNPAGCIGLGSTL